MEYQSTPISSILKFVTIVICEYNTNESCKRSDSKHLVSFQREDDKNKARKRNKKIEER